MKAIITRFVPAGGSGARGSRYVATDGDFRVYVGADDTLNSDQNHEAALRKFCKRFGYTGGLVRGGLMKSGHMEGYVWVWRQERLQTAYELAIQ